MFSYWQNQFSTIAYNQIMVSKFLKIAQMCHPNEQ
jgi:hypothetical protein